MDDDEDIPSLSLILEPARVDPTPTRSAPRPEAPTTFHRFLDLPLEIRHMVYRRVLARPNPIISLCSNSGFGLGPQEPHGPIVEVSLFATSKAIFEEATSEFLLQNTIRLNDMNVCKLKTTDGQRNTIRNARHLIVLFQPRQHRNFYKDARVFDFEFPRFRHVETLYLVLFHAVEPCPSKDTYQRIGKELNEWAKLWVRKKVTIEWRDTSESKEIPQTPAYLMEKDRFARYLPQLERSMVKGQRPKWIKEQAWG
ncbi:hypothetical protein E2P81_ATG11430 [Venturia nashicola]|uniref:Uncharacterized protein n=1 Tax=Venturia nashicola TaxID=86259 RepID=A0A4Z1P4C6_9PEZI|nr:hypothetical protein E6O75_ATG11122 [Venturia nashicola]TLD35311.1 hypothetical protein E2P81_ATG11430 [Venturia nashicola]